MIILICAFYISLAFQLYYVFGGSVLVQCPGPCSMIEDCDIAWRLLQKEERERTNEEFIALKSAFCGYNSNNRVKICCQTVKDRIHPETLKDRSHPETAKERIHPGLDLLPKNCGFIDGDRVIGGRVSGLKEFPWMALVSLKTKGGPLFKCGGSVINSRYVLTAGHCVVNKMVLGVRVGEHDLTEDKDCQGTTTITCSDPVQDIPVERVILHQNHSSSNGKFWAHDIALLRLQGTIDFNRNNARPVCLPTTMEEQQRQLRGLSAVIPGWGATENGPMADVLMKAYIPIYSKEDCVSFYESESVPTWSRTSTATFVCAGVMGVDSCQGDSGGPLLVSGKHGGYQRYIQYGISSFGETKCGSGRPSLYTDVVLHMPWILDNLES